MREVLSPFFRRWRPHVALIAHSLPGTEDPVRRLLYPSIGTPPEAVDPKRGERMLRKILDRRRFRGWPVPRRFRLDPESPVRSYMDQTPSTEHGTRRNGPGFWNLPMPIATAVECGPRDMVFYDGEGYDKVRDALRKAGIRHVLLTGYATDMCVIRTTCGYQNLSRDFNVFLVGDATLATFPGSRTPRFVTQAALTSASLSQMITQVSWVRLVPPSSGTGEAP
jgi:nicotinamidase-related amidase